MAATIAQPRRGRFSPNGWGQAFIAAQALAVLLLAEFEFMGLRRSRLAMA